MDWKLDEAAAALSSDSIHARIVIVNRENKTAATSLALPVRINNINAQRYEQHHNMRIERYGLILFDFDKSILNRTNPRVLDLVKSSITPQSKVLIRGYADRTGSSEYNKSLAGMRCSSVREYLGTAVENDQVFLDPVGSDLLLFDNNLPEGRCYNRIVYITIETPE